MKKLILSTFVLALLLITSQLAFTYSGSAPPAGKTNAPGEGNCTECHSDFSLATSGALWDSVELTTSVPLSQLQPNTTYTMTLHFGTTSGTKYGFELVALPSGSNSSTASVGTLTATTPQTEVNTQGNRDYMSHSNIGTAATANSISWTFDYTTPSTPSVSVDFFVVVNSTNNNSSSSGDQIFAKVFTSTIMPVKWLSFGVKGVQNTNLVEWSTASETNNNYFEIERSSDAVNWEKIAHIKSKGNGNKVLKYAYNDEDVAFSKGFYRIKQVDFNGRFDYSKVLFLDRANQTTRVQYDAREQMIHLSNTAQIAPATLFSLSGRPVAKSDDGISINVQSTEKGIYVLQLPSGVYTKILIY